MIAWRLGLLLLLVGFAAPAAAAGPLPFARALPWDHVASAHAGDWAEYVVRVGDHPVGPWLRFLVLGHDESGTWVEIWISENRGSATQAYRLLVDERGRTRRLVGRLLGGPSRELPLPNDADEGPPDAAAPAFVTLGEEAVQTGAGILRATRIESRDGPRWVARAWVAREVPIFGLARMDLASGTGLELSGWGRGGRGVVDLPAVGSGAVRGDVPHP